MYKSNNSTIILIISLIFLLNCIIRSVFKPFFLWIPVGILHLLSLVISYYTYSWCNIFDIICTILIVLIIRLIWIMTINFYYIYSSLQLYLKMISYLNMTKTTYLLAHAPLPPGGGAICAQWHGTWDALCCRVIMR